MDSESKVLTAQEVYRKFQSQTHASRTRCIWGPWAFWAHNRTIECYDEDGSYLYAVDLDVCRTPAAVLDVIYQVRSKRWCTPAVMLGLLEAFRDLLDPQANLCSGGASKSIVPAELLAGRYGVDNS